MILGGGAKKYILSGQVFNSVICFVEYQIWGPPPLDPAMVRTLYAHYTVYICYNVHIQEYSL